MLLLESLDGCDWLAWPVGVKVIASVVSEKNEKCERFDLAGRMVNDDANWESHLITCITRWGLGLSSMSAATQSSPTSKK